MGRWLFGVGREAKRGDGKAVRWRSVEFASRMEEKKPGESDLGREGRDDAVEKDNLSSGKRRDGQRTCSFVLVSNGCV